MVKYTYDAWGNHTVSGSNLTLGNLTPFRYRSYFYDTETKLYYLKTRYYDPEVGRFINMDSVQYADLETINGLNLYAYCNNNPVMNEDPTGEFIISLIFAFVVGAAASAATSIVTQLATTGSVSWSQVGISALFGGISGAFALTGIGSTVGQFLIQGFLAVGENIAMA